MTYEKELANQMLGNAVEYGHSRTISFTTTHPNVSISIFKGGMEPDTYLEVFRNHDIKEKTDTNFANRQGLEFLKQKFEMVVQS
jgi:hypothetical protein